MEKPRRKPLRLPDFDYKTGGAYYVTICTHERKKILSDVVDVGAHPRVRPRLIGKVCENRLRDLEIKYPDVTLDYHCIMPNHIHFVLFKEGAHIGAPLHEIIKWFKTQTTNDCIKLVKEGKITHFDKHIWQRNYYEHIIRGEQDLYEIRKYIDENPVKWSLDKYYK